MLPLHPLVLAATLFAALFATTVFSADDLCVLFVTSHIPSKIITAPSRVTWSRFIPRGRKRISRNYEYADSCIRVNVFLVCPILDAEQLADQTSFFFLDAGLFDQRNPLNRSLR